LTALKKPIEAAACDIERSGEGVNLDPISPLLDENIPRRAKPIDPRGFGVAADRFGAFGFLGSHGHDRPFILRKATFEALIYSTVLLI
jgi:hypothetical protein